MSAYIVRRLLQAIPMLFGISVVVFALLQLAPGSPVAYLIPTQALDPDQQRRIAHQLGLDLPVWMQYWQWLTRVLHGDFGTAYTYGVPVSQLILDRLPATLELQVAAILFSIIVAIPVGVLAAVKRYSRIDHLVTTTSLFGLSMPNFWFALILIQIFSLRLGWLPTFGDGSNAGTIVDRFPYFVMPVLVLGLATVPWYARFMRSSMLDVLQQDYIRAACARGVPERLVLFRHALKPAILPVITVIGLSLPRLVGGSVIVETIYAWPGIGRLAYDSILRKDFPVVMALTLLTAAFVIVLNLVMDVVYTQLDPRISYE